FVRVSVAPSHSDSLYPVDALDNSRNLNTATATVGTVLTLTPTVIADIHYNFSQTLYHNVYGLPNTPDVKAFENAVSAANIQFPNVDVFGLGTQAIYFFRKPNNFGRQRQNNLLGSFAIKAASHSIKIGYDGRLLLPYSQ